MTALGAERMGSIESWDTRVFTLKSGTKAYKGAAAVIVLTENVVAPATSATGRVAIGTFAETVDATSAAAPVAVKLDKELWVRRFANAPGGDAVAAADLGKVCYFYDDQTVTITDTGRSIAGRVWDVDSSKGVAVEMLSLDPAWLAALVDPVDGATLAFVAADCAVTAAQLVNSAVFACPATDADSTITLAVTNVAVGTRVFFIFDGTANDYDVSIRYGTTVIGKVAAGSLRTVECIKASATTWQAITDIPKPLLGGAAPAEVGDDVILTAAEIIHDGLYTLPTLDANATVTLPVTGVADGTRIWFAVASPGAYTVTYRYGTTAISAAITASKAHAACCIKLGSAWYALVTVGP